MGLFVISDLHLGLGMGKTMDRFGGRWVGHVEKLKKNWMQTVTKEDMVVIPGDISWGKTIDEARPDFAFLDELPGKKVFFCGNHDYWWDSLSKLSQAFPQMIFVKNNFVVYQDIALCGTRGWVCPNDSFFQPQDEKIYKREEGRLRLSFHQALEKGYRRIFVFTHYPPTNDKKEPSLFTNMYEAYQSLGVEKVFYGHLHGEDFFNVSLQGTVRGISYQLVSGDYLDFVPYQIL